VHERGADLDEEVDSFDGSLELGGRAIGLLERNKHSRNKANADQNAVIDAEGGASCSAGTQQSSLREGTEEEFPF